MEHRRTDFQDRLDVVGGILIRCFLGGILLLLVWFVGFVSAGDWMYGVHSRWFQIPRQSFDAIHYAGMALTKILLLLFALLPYLAIKLVSGKTGAKSRKLL